MTAILKERIRKECPFVGVDIATLIEIREKEVDKLKSSELPFMVGMHKMRSREIAQLRQLQSTINNNI